jgi:hypothetical protein
MLTSAPRVCRSAGMVAWETRKTPSRLVAITVRQREKSVSSIWPKSATPALLTTASMRPKLVTTDCTMSST